MSDQADQEKQKSSARGEAAWRETTDRIAERNKAVRKAGKQEREAYERGREAARREAERQLDAGLLAKHLRP